MSVEPVACGRARLAAERLSAGPATAVALHAGVTDRRSWVPLAQALHGRVGIVAYDRRAYGETTYEAEPHRQVDDLQAVIDAVGPARPPWLLGASQGGRIAIDLALERPGAVRGLLLVAPAVSGVPDPPDPASDEAYRRGDLDEVARLDARAWLDGPEAREGRVTGLPREHVLQAVGRVLRAEDPGPEAEPPPALERLGELDLPVLVVLGSLDHAVVRALGEHVAEAAPGGTLTVVPGTAHLPHLERPGQVAAAIATFLQAAGG